ncbi:hypothetical protein MILUP08_42776 [Micromonospora lupini str. Lupac 08]|uniref:Uncharacterized protein n=1 Tax=Micromonospora lupini str. Lupac 08 TaxID=1150864 RepID=I0L1Z8_9ACTN|nr:hypothetical protein MILUP08_42776 [Micromonospora lupini str. Lupac 08]
MWVFGYDVWRKRRTPGVWVTTLTEAVTLALGQPKVIGSVQVCRGGEVMSSTQQARNV